MSTQVSIEITKLDSNAQIPKYAHESDSGLDLHSTVCIVLPKGGGRSLVPTGIAVAIPFGYGGFVLPRSGLASKFGVTVVNAPGLIDSGYRGEIMVPMINTDPNKDFEVEIGMRIAQLVVLITPKVIFTQVPTLGCSPDRGSQGFGSSGLLSQMVSESPQANPA